MVQHDSVCFCGANIFSISIAMFRLPDKIFQSAGSTPAVLLDPIKARHVGVELGHVPAFSIIQPGPAKIKQRLFSIPGSAHAYPNIISRVTSTKDNGWTLHQGYSLCLVPECPRSPGFTWHTLRKKTSKDHWYQQYIPSSWRPTHCPTCKPGKGR